MKHYDTPTSRDGLRLPYSGFIIGKLAEALRLKAMLREDFEAVSYKTVQRYFSGERIKPESVELVLDALVDSLVPAEFVLGTGYIEEFPLRLLIGNSLRDYALAWDQMAAEANSHMFDVTSTGDLSMAVLRLVALDLGVRIGGWAALRFLMDRPLDWKTTWLNGGGLKRFIDEKRSEIGLSVEKLAEKVGVSSQTIEAWRSGSSLPTNAHVEDLAWALVEEDVGPEAEYTVRVLVGIEQLHADLQEVLGEDRLRDLLRGVMDTAKQVEGVTRKYMSMEPPPTLPLPMISNWDKVKAAMKAKMLQGALWELPVHGARCRKGVSTTKVLAEEAAWRPEAAADFAVLSGDWTPRIHYWLRHVGSMHGAVEFMKENVPPGTEMSSERAEMLARAVVEGPLFFGDMFWQPDEDTQVVTFSPPPFGKAMNRAAQAQVAMSVGGIETAIEHLRHVVRHQPQDAVLHFKLGCALWQWALPRGDLGFVEEALLELRVAVQLDPNFGNARNEIGVVLSNLRRHEEAEVAFAEAEPYDRQHNHHWFCRGGNYLALGRLEDARAAFVKAIELTGGGDHVEAKVRLAGTLMALGHKREARALGQRVAFRIGWEPAEHWPQALDVWNDMTPGQKIGRNDRCPCHSGKKYKHCHGR